jgi:7-cyano-7-deazaguanine synthase in queuosine biosynthesis
MRKVLLYSGGTDSWLIAKLTKPDVLLYFDIGTESCKGEMQKLPSNVVIDKTLSGLGHLERDDGSFIVPLRNMFFIARAAEYGDHIILGANKTDAHNDKTYAFAEKMQDLLNYYYGPSEDGLCEIKDIVVDFSFKNYTKPELVKLYLDNGGSAEEYINESFSCYTPTEDLKECHNCKPCFNKMMSLYLNNVPLPKGYLHSFLPFLKGIKKHRYFDMELIEQVIKEAEEDV